MFDLKKYRKAVTAVITAAVVLATAFAPGNATVHSALATIVAVAGALGVYVVPNEG